MAATRHLSPARHTPGRRARRAPLVFGVAGAVLLPWIVVLAYTLPTTAVAAHWRLAWLGLDGGEVVGLLATAYLATRRDLRAPLAATATATLLTVDAWFDVLTSAPADLPVALAEALALELPLAVCCLTFAWRRLTDYAAANQQPLEPSVTWADIPLPAASCEELAPLAAA